MPTIQPDMQRALSLCREWDSRLCNRSDTPRAAMLKMPCSASLVKSISATGIGCWAIPASAGTCTGTTAGPSSRSSSPAWIRKAWCWTSPRSSKPSSQWLDANLDHRMVLHRDDPAVPVLEQLGEPMFLMDANPTAENIAKLIYEFAVEQGLAGGGSPSVGNAPLLRNVLPRSRDEGRGARGEELGFQRQFVAGGFLGVAHRADTARRARSCSTSCLPEPEIARERCWPARASPRPAPSHRTRPSRGANLRPAGSGRCRSGRFSTRSGRYRARCTPTPRRTSRKHTRL